MLAIFQNHCSRDASKNSSPQMKIYMAVDFQPRNRRSMPVT